MVKLVIVLVVLFVCTTFASQLVSRGNLRFPEIEFESENFLTEPCSPLNDVWGFSTDEAEFAVTGVSNGVVIVDVTDPSEPSVVGFPYVGCITSWRDMKTYQNYLYVVNDYTTLCDCSADQQPCQQQLLIEYGNSQTQEFRAAEGRAQAPLSNFPDGVSGLVEYPSSDETGCSPLTEDLTNKIALIDRGNCTFTEKTLHAQAAGAVGIILADNSQDAIYPSMSGNNTGINIPGLLIGSEDARTLKTLVGNLGNVTAYLDSSNRENSTLYKGPDGWYILDISDPSNVSVVTQTHEFFDYAHNILVDPLDRALVYVCGQSSNSFNDTGGVLVFDLTDPMNPQLIANFSTAYIHDIEVVSREDGQIVLYGCAIYDGLLYVIDVTDPWSNPDLNNQVISVTETIESPHNSAQTEDGAFLYITHEEFTYPVTIWNSTDLTNLTYVSQFSVNAEQGTSPHNVMIDGNELWMGYYSEGVLVYNIENNPASPEQMGQYDTSTYETGFHGVWGIYPYAPSNITYASDIESGLWLLKLVGEPTVSPTPSPSPTPAQTIAAPNSTLSSTPSATPVMNQTMTYATSNTTNAEETNTNDNTFLWITISAGVVLSIIVLLIFVAVVAFVIIKKRTANNQSTVDDFDGRIDEDDLF